MGIIKHKKETMQVAKFLYCFFTVWIILSFHASTAQSLKGTFDGDDGITYHFSDSTFKTVSLLHVGKKIAKGFYTVRDDTLCLNFEPAIDPSPSNFKFIKKEKNPIPFLSTSRDTVSFSIQFKIVNSEGEPIEGAILALYNKAGSTIMGFTADSLGNFPRLSIVNDIVRAFKFSFLGYEDMTIKADPLAGYSSNVRVILSKIDTYSDYDGTKKYLIKEKAKDRIVLQSLETNEKLVLEREGSK